MPSTQPRLRRRRLPWRPSRRSDTPYREQEVGGLAPDKPLLCFWCCGRGAAVVYPLVVADLRFGRVGLSGQALTTICAPSLLGSLLTDRAR